jgi:hypothetical protein
MTIVEALRELIPILSRYVVEVPTGHQPHMMALKAHDALDNARAALAAHDAQPAAEPVAERTAFLQWAHDCGMTSVNARVPAWAAWQARAGAAPAAPQEPT